MSNEYNISICMAGAVSAGAYSAGVMTELLESLRVWNDQNADLPFRPTHKVNIVGMSGASAGSIQAVLSMLDALSDTSGGRRQNLGKDAWFSASINKLLDNKDLENIEAKSDQIRSVLNSQALRDIAEEALTSHKWANSWPEWVKKPLPIRLSVTNLRGVPYNLSLPFGNKTEFGMSTHNEYARFSITDQINNSNVDDEVLFGAEDFGKLIDGALASSAFPVAFSPVKVKRPGGSDNGFHNHKNWLSPTQAILNLSKVDISFDKINVNPDWRYGNVSVFYAVDGGATNNEPLLEAFKILLGDDADSWIAPDGSMQDGKVIMVDPFPNAVDKEINKEDIRIDKSIGLLLSALVGHARFNEPLLVSEKLRNRVGLVYPSLPDRNEKNLMALRSGALGGFSGFLKQEFLHHDFALGRLNMRRFLRYHFTLEDDHPLFKSWSSDIKNAWRTDDNKFPILPVYVKEGNDYVVFECANEDKEDYYNSILNPLKANFTLQDQKKLRSALVNRLKKLGTLLIKTHIVMDSGEKEGGAWPAVKRVWRNSTGSVTGFAIVRGWNWLASGFLSNSVVRTIENALYQQGYLDYKPKHIDKSDTD